MGEEGQRSSVRRELPAPAITVVHVPTEVVLYTVSEQELEALASGSTSLDVAYLGMAVGGLVSLLITLLTVSLGPKIFATFVALFTLSAFSAVLFAIRTYTDLKITKRHLERIKERRNIAPL